MDIDSGVRGLGGCKKPFDIKDLPSHEKYVKNDAFTAPENETEEERLARHRAFFESLKNMVQHEEEVKLHSKVQGLDYDLHQAQEVPNLNK